MRLETFRTNLRIKSVNTFICNAGNSLKTFRYFNSRSVADALRGHLVTMLYYDDFDRPVGYGHLDEDSGNVWLGICVAEGHTGKKIGKFMMKRLLATADRNVSLVKLIVDRDNDSAIHLYKKFGFEEVGDNSPMLMERKRPRSG